MKETPGFINKLSGFQEKAEGLMFLAECSSPQFVELFSNFDGIMLLIICVFNMNFRIRAQQSSLAD